MNTLPLESNGNISLKKLSSKEEFDTFKKITVNENLELINDYDNVRESIQKKLKKLGKQDKELRFLTKIIYKKNNQTTDLQSTIHIGPKEMAEKIEQEKNNSSVAIHEGIEPHDLMVDYSPKKTSQGFEDTSKYISIRKQDIEADTSEKEIKKNIQKNLSTTEVEIVDTQQRLTESYANNFPNKINHELYIETQNNNRAESVLKLVKGRLNLFNSFSEEKINHTANLEGVELKESTEEVINEINMIVIEINNTKKSTYRNELIELFHSMHSTYLAPLRYIWHTQGDTKKTEWLNNQISRFNDPQLNIDYILDKKNIIENRNNIAASTISRIPETYKTIHANYGETHTSGIHQRLLQEGWTLEDIELMPIKYKKVAWWKRLEETIKYPFWKFKNRKERRKLKKLHKQAKKENKQNKITSSTQFEIIDKKGRSKLLPLPEIEDAPTGEKQNPRPELKLEKTEEPKDESLDTAA